MPSKKDTTNPLLLERRARVLAAARSEGIKFVEDATAQGPLLLETRARTVFAAARAEGIKFVEDATAHADSIQTALARMREQHEGNRHDLLARIQANEEEIHALRPVYSTLLNEVVPRRIHTVDVMKSMLQESEVEMRRSRKRLMEKIKARLDDAREKQKLAMDASALVKHYKALILAP